MRRYYKTGLILAALLIVGSYATTIQAASLTPSQVKTITTVASKVKIPINQATLIKLLQSPAGRRQFLQLMHVANGTSLPFLPDACQDCRNDCIFDLAICLLAAAVGCEPCALLCLAAEAYCLNKCNRVGQPCGPKSCP